ncbi:hypothetical protein ACDP63_15940 [Paracoccus sp. P2]|uniref:Uncharacterized protein n=1 Tax=Paracoccus pantotrophus TaxID=82367 RepID=A0A1I5K9I6_PARPN|nr:hypothetical protein [Paracoccus pantotrophus]MDF3855796.1 hypothetical protein [Paracoccus pantotrophus]QFG35774.1 hypothetical protein ESD82_06355 [Paracoccus pantotrophus]QLH14045.1 hypothetical protein HYQ43_07295 [Paracoccus pantotrophus]RDD97254.1 hypothetical protein DTW92_08835 [Paracoccus pantotrophus]RKS43978.1 hypothetical protein BDE18_2806 [Paracoccus pantotrophus]
MTMLNHLSAFADRALQAAMPASPRYAVSLIDRRTGKPHRISGIPLRLITCDPFETARDLMRHRDPARWDTAIHRLDRKGAIQ